MSNMSRDVIFAEKENGAPMSRNELREGVRVGYKAGLGGWGTGGHRATHTIVSNGRISYFLDLCN